MRRAGTAGALTKTDVQKIKSQVYNSHITKRARTMNDFFLIERCRRSFRPSIKVYFLALALLANFTNSARAETSCPRPAPVTAVTAVSPYVSEQSYAESTRDVRGFIGLIVASADHEAGAISRQCAIENLTRWADAGALLNRPANFEGGRQRIRYAFALNIGALKLGINHHEHGAIIEWLRNITSAVASDYARHRQQRGSSDNLYVWSGATAASFLLHTDDVSLRGYQQDVWRDALVSIKPSGSVRLEELRGTRSIPYHTYYLSALLWLKIFRDQIGENRSQEDSVSIKRLISFIKNEICSPSGDGPNPTSVRQPDTIRTEALQVLDHSLWDALRKCGLRPSGHRSHILGGNFDATMRLFSRR